MRNILKGIVQYLGLLLLLVVGTWACTAELDLVSEGMEAELVISGVLSTEPGEQTIEIAVTGPYFDQELPSTIDASKVCLNGVELKRLYQGVYVTEKDFAAQEGATYRLEVWIDRNGDHQDEYYTATTTVPYVHQLRSLSLKSMSLSGKEDLPFILVAGMEDTPGEQQHYGFSLSVNGELYSNRILRYFVLTLNDYTYRGDTVYIPLYDWVIYTSSLIWDNGGEFPLYQNDELTVELQTLSKEYYNYLKDAKTEKNQQFPLFSGPRGNVVGNIEGGAWGIFGSYAVSKKSVRLPECQGLPKRPN